MVNFRVKPWIIGQTTSEHNLSCSVPVCCASLIFCRDCRLQPFRAVFLGSAYENAIFPCLRFLFGKICIKLLFVYAGPSPRSWVLPSRREPDVLGVLVWTILLSKGPPVRFHVNRWERISLKQLRHQEPFVHGDLDVGSSHISGCKLRHTPFPQVPPNSTEHFPTGARRGGSRVNILREYMHHRQATSLTRGPRSVY